MPEKLLHFNELKTMLPEQIDKLGSLFEFVYLDEKTGKIKKHRQKWVGFAFTNTVSSCNTDVVVYDDKSAHAVLN